MSHTVVVEQHSSEILAPLLTGAFGLLAALIGAGLTHMAATRREERTRRETVAREQRNRQADIDRERLRDLREVVDEAAVALHDLWGILNAFRAAIPRGPGESPLPPGVPVGVSVTQARSPDRSAYIAAHLRLSDAHTRLTLRVERDDALLGPVLNAVGRSQEAWNTIVLQDDPFTPERTTEEKRRIKRALHACASAYPNLTKAAKMRFASDPLPGTLRRFSLSLDTQPARRSGRDVEDVLPALRKGFSGEIGAAVGPHPETGVVTVRGVAETAEEFRADVLRRLDEAGENWRDYLAMSDDTGI